MKRGYIFYYVPEMGYVIEDFCPMLETHRACRVYETPQAAQEGINQLIRN